MTPSEARPDPQRARRSGFALPAVLAVTGVVVLIFLVAITALAAMTAEAANARARVRFLERALTAEAALVWLTATEPIDSASLRIGAPRRYPIEPGEEPPPLRVSGLETGDVFLDGRPYRLALDDQPLLVSIRDQAGMINLARLEPEAQRRLLERLGVAPGQIDALAARLLDYVDQDDLRQVGGAERDDYPVGVPANRPLRRVDEWLSVLGARQAVDPVRWRALRPHLIADHQSPAINLNTASSEALQILFDLTPDRAQAALSARRAAPFLDYESFVAASGTGVPGDPEGLYAFPIGRFIYEIRDSRSAWTYRARLTLSPRELERPFWIDQTEMREAPRRARADTTDADQFPYAPR